MKFILFNLIFLFLTSHLLNFSTSLYAAVPEIITYQGTLRKDGAIHTGTVPMEFKITNQDGSATYWTSSSTSVYVSAGLFRYSLGTPNESQFQSILWQSITPYIQVIVDGSALPIEPLYSSIYSLHAKSAESIKGDFTLYDTDVRITTTTGTRGIIFQDGSFQYKAAGDAAQWEINATHIYNLNPGNVGIGISNPGSRLEVSGTVRASAFQGDGSNVTNIAASSVNQGSFPGTSYVFPSTLTISGPVYLGSVISSSFTDSGALQMGQNAGLTFSGGRITGLQTPLANDESASKAYVDGLTGGGQAAAVLSSTQTFTGQNTFVNQISVSSNLFVTAGNIGIGTTTPDTQLGVWGVGKFMADTTGGQLVIQGATNANNKMYIGYNTTSNYGFIEPVTEGTAYRNLILSQNGGNIGIGETSPVYKLHIADGDVKISTTSGSRGIIFQDGSVQTSASGANSWAISGSDIYNANSGNVGIGITNPQAKLDVLENIRFKWLNANADYVSNLSNTFLILPQTAAGQDARFTIRNYAGDEIFAVRDRTQVGESNSVVINYNVGIGTATPDEKLHVAGGALAVQTDGTANKILKFKQGGITDTTGRSMITTSWDTSYWLMKLGTIGFDPTLILRAGNVGIGTASPGVLLQVQKTVASAFPTLGTASGNLALIGNGGAWGMYVGLDDTGAGWIQQMRNDSATPYNLSLQPVGGNVGIGTTGPATKLHISDPSASSGPSIRSSAAGGSANNKHWEIRNGSVDVAWGDLDFTALNDDGTVKGTRLMLKNDGNVGIGTTGPGAKLHVAGGNVRIDNNYALWTRNAANTSDVNMIYMDSANMLLVGSAGVTGDLAFSAGGERMRINSTSGYVGIGTTGPVNKLSVAGTVDIGVASVEGGLSINSYNGGGHSIYSKNGYLLIQSSSLDPHIVLSPGGSGNVGIGTTGPVEKLTVVGGYPQIGIEGSDAVIRYKDTSQNYEFWAGVGYTGSGWEVYDRTNSASRLFIDTSGNVGIGTTSPNYKFEVNTGTMTITSGTLYSKGASMKLIMTSPDGTCSSCGPDNADAWACASVTCP